MAGKRSGMAEGPEFTHGAPRANSEAQILVGRTRSAHAAPPRRADAGGRRGAGSRMISPDGAELGSIHSIGRVPPAGAEGGLFGSWPGGQPQALRPAPGMAGYSGASPQQVAPRPAGPPATDRRHIHTRHGVHHVRLRLRVRRRG
jgi:hypothetical protein